MALLLLVMSSKGIQAQQWADTVVLVSLDGFRSTYVDDYDTPFLDALITSGVHSPEGMIPVFPTSTFPNHYSMATGLYPPRPWNRVKHVFRPGYRRMVLYLK